MFNLEKNLVGEAFLTYDLFPTTASTSYKLGEILTLSSGALVAAGVDSDGTQKFVCGTDYEAPASGMKPIPVAALTPNQVFRTKFSAAPTSRVAGDKVTLTATTLDGVTATTTKGVAEIYDMLGATASGDEVLVRFV